MYNFVQKNILENRYFLRNWRLHYGCWLPLPYFLKLTSLLGFAFIGDAIIFKFEFAVFLYPRDYIIMQLFRNSSIPFCRSPKNIDWVLQYPQKFNKFYHIFVGASCGYAVLCFYPKK